MTYSLRGSYIHRKHSTGRHVPRQPRQLRSVSLTRSRSCMTKIRPRERRSSVSPVGQTSANRCPKGWLSPSAIRVARQAHPAAARTRDGARREISTPAARSRANSTKPYLAYANAGACSHVVFAGGGWPVPNGLGRTGHPNELALDQTQPGASSKVGVSPCTVLVAWHISAGGEG
jgi:hypothetical protein